LYYEFTNGPTIRVFNFVLFIYSNRFELFVIILPKYKNRKERRNWATMDGISGTHVSWEKLYVYLVMCSRPDSEPPENCEIGKRHQILLKLGEMSSYYSTVLCFLLYIVGHIGNWQLSIQHSYVSNLRIKIGLFFV